MFAVFIPPKHCFDFFFRGLATDLFVLIFSKNSRENCRVILLIEQEEYSNKAQQQKKIKTIRNFWTFNFDNDKLSDLELKSDLHRHGQSLNVTDGETLFCGESVAARNHVDV